MKLISFHSKTCAPCRSAAPVVDAVGRSTGLSVESVDVERFPDFTGAYRVTTVPTVVLVDLQGSVIARFTGLAELPELARTAAALSH